MLAGLLFAIHDADDQPGRLMATLPFAGATLIERQARQLVAAGAAQLIVVATRLPPDLLGALSRIGRQGVTVDAVRSASEAAEKLHPLARVLVLADGLVAADAAVATLAHEGGDALLVLAGEEAVRGVERLGGRMAWAGVARLQPLRITEVAALPRDYDVQSTLIRVAEQAGAAHVPLATAIVRQGHGLATGARGLAERGRRLLASLFAGRRNWLDRWIAAPIAGMTLPALVGRGVTGAMVGVVAGVVAVVAVMALVRGFTITGALLGSAATLAMLVGEVLASLRGEHRAAAWQRGGARAVPLVAVLLIGWTCTAQSLDDGPLVAAAGLTMLTGLGERAAGDVREVWWGSAPAYLLVVMLAALVGGASWGIGFASIYAAATLAAVIERLRAQA